MTPATTLWLCCTLAKVTRGDSFLKMHEKKGILFHKTRYIGAFKVSLVTNIYNMLLF